MKKLATKIDLRTGIFFLILFSGLTIAQTPELRIQLGHSKIVYSVAYSPDGKYVASGSADFTFKLWEVETGKEVRTFRGHKGYVTSICFSPDGKHLLSGGGSYDIGELKLWELETGKLVREFLGHKEYVWDAKFNKSGTRIVSGSFDQTIKLWDVNSGMPIQSLTDSIENIYAVSFTKDEQHVISGGGYFSSEIFMWSLSNGKIVRKFESPSNERVEGMDLSQNGERLATADSKGVKLWDVATGKLIRTFEGHTDWVSAVVFAQDGQQLFTGSFDTKIKKWDVNTGKELDTLSGHRDRIYALALGPDGKTLLSGGSFDKSLKIWDVASGKTIKTLAGHNLPVSSLVFSRDGKFLLSSGHDNSSHQTKLERWNLENNERHTFFSGAYGELKDLDVNPIADELLVAGPAHWLMLVQHQEEKTWRNLESHTSAVNGARFSPDGKYMVSTSNDYDKKSELKLWLTDNRKVILQVEGLEGETYEADFTPDSKSILVITRPNMARYSQLEKWGLTPGGFKKEYLVKDSVNWSLKVLPDGKDFMLLAGKKIEIRDVASGRLKRNLQLESNQDYPAFCFAVSPDGQFIAIGGGNWGNTELSVWSLETGKLVTSLAGHISEVTALTFSPKGDFLVSGGNDTQIKFWDYKKGRELMSLQGMDGQNSDYVAVTPDGLFDGTQQGIQTLLHYVIGSRLIELAQLKDRYFEPGLIKKVIKGEELRNVSGFKSIELPPDIRVGQVDADGYLPVTLINRGGGIGEVNVFMNGKEVIKDARDVNTKVEVPTLSLKVFVGKHKNIVKGQENLIAVKAWNAGHWVVSRGQIVSYQSKEIEQYKPAVHILTCGISDYTGNEIDLKYAAKDAADMSLALQLGAKKLFGTERSFVYKLTTSETKDKYPTKVNILKAFEKISSAAHPLDVFVMYVSGHGINYGGQDGDWHYLTQEAYSSSASAYNDPAIRQQTTLSSNDLVELFKKVPALKQVLILDACASGKVVDNLIAQKDIESSTLRALDRMRDRTGMHIITGCAADAVSYEASKYGQGVLTYSLLEGIRGAALRDEQYIDVNKLFQYAQDRVPKLAEGIGGIQSPQVFSPQGAQSFDIGLLSDAEKKEIPIAKIRPVYIRSNFQDEDELEDVLGIGKAIDESLNEASTKGIDAPLIFVDVREYPDACKLIGRYRKQGNQIVLKLRKKCGIEDKTFNLQADDLEALKVLVLKEISQ